MKKRILFLSVLVVASVMCFCLSGTNKNKKSENNNTKDIAAAGCVINTFNEYGTASGANYKIFDGSKTIDRIANASYTCETSSCYVKYTGDFSKYGGLAGNNRCDDGGWRRDTENGVMYCTGTKIDVRPCPKSTGTNSSSVTTNSSTTSCDLTIAKDSNVSSFSPSINGNFSMTRAGCWVCNSSDASCYVVLNGNGASLSFKSGYEIRGISNDGCSTVGFKSTEAIYFGKNLKRNLTICSKNSSGVTTKPTTNSTVPSTNNNQSGTSSFKISAYVYPVSAGSISGLNANGAYNCSSTSCRPTLKAVSSNSSYYEFKGWANSETNCKNGIYIYGTTNPLESTFYSNSIVYACFKEVSVIQSKYYLNVRLADSSVGSLFKPVVDENKLSVTSSSFGYTVTCFDDANINNVCAATIKAESKNFLGWSINDSSCKNVVGTSTYYVDFSKDVYSGVVQQTYYACYKKNSNVTTSNVGTTNNSSSGGGSGGSTYVPPVTEPAVIDTFTNLINTYMWAKGSEYQGNSIACGDKLYITKCNNDSDTICMVTTINGKNTTTTTQIKKSNLSSTENGTGCFKEIIRYISENTSSYTNSELSTGKTDLSCGTKVIFKESIETSCTNLSCKVNINGSDVYVDRSKLLSDKPACDDKNSQDTCTSSTPVKDLKDIKTIKICKDDDTEKTRNSIVTCSSDYEMSYSLLSDTCKDSTNKNCYREYKYTCNYVKRPSLSASAGTIGNNGLGTITFTAKDNGNVGIKGYFTSNGDAPTLNSNWKQFSDTTYKSSETKSAGTYFIWVLNNKNRMSYPIMAKVYDADLSTTLSSFSIMDAQGNNVSLNTLDDNTVAMGKVIDSKYALLSNELLNSSEIAGFQSLNTAYELTVVSNKVSIYATLTSGDASYVTGYEPRTIDLEYGRNVALIKIVNKNGKERTYTFIINRVDDRDGSNLLSDISISKGKINFDSYVSSYDVSIPKNTKKISINAELASNTSAFIEGYAPREVLITEDIQSFVLKVKSESGSIRSYVITFVKNGADDSSEENSTYLSSLTVPGTQLGFNKEVYDYTISVPYDTTTIPIYAFAESSNAVVNVGNNSGLQVGNNLIEIEIKNGNKTRVYSLHVIRKESGLDISDSDRLAMLSIKNYKIDFNPNILDYVVKIKREKTLLITASPESNRADVYMYGNNDLTGFSTVRVKVIAENGRTNIYSIDIQKDAYNKKIEIIASTLGGLIVLGTTIIIVVKNKRKKMKEYLEG